MNRNAPGQRSFDGMKDVTSSASGPSVPVPFGRVVSSGGAQDEMEKFLDLPLLETLNRINAQVGGLQKQLAKVDDQVTASMQPSEDQDGKPKTFLTGVEEMESKQQQHSRRRSSIRISSVKPAVVRSVEDAMFPGAGIAPADLPNQISGQEVLKRLAERLEVTKGKDGGAWEKGLADMHTQEIMKDLFWWFFAEKFENQPGMPEQQEKMFGRMAANFICLLTTVPQAHKDRFFARYHDVVSQATFAVFRVAFPNSEGKLDNAFRAELQRLFAYWTTGADIGPSEYILKNGREVKRHVGSALADVVGAMQREQAEMDIITTDKKSKAKPAPPASTKPTGAGGGGGRTVGARRAGSPTNKTGGGDAGAGGGGGGQGGRGGAGGGGGGGGLPPVPPLRLPPKPDTELRTPRAIWTDRTGVGASKAATPRGGAKTDRPAVPRPPSSSRGEGEGGRRNSVVSFASSEGGNGRRTPQSARSGASSHRSGKSGSASHRTASTAKGAVGPGEEGRQTPRGRAFDRDGRRPFDLNGMSPFVAYYMTTQVSSATTSKRLWNKIHCDETVKAWDQPKPVKRRPLGDAEEEDEDPGAYPKSPREIGEAAVKRNARIVREYQKKASARGVSIGAWRRTLTKQNRETRAELQGIHRSQDLSNAFSNMLVSSGGGVNFDAVWKKQGPGIMQRFGGLEPPPVPPLGTVAAGAVGSGQDQSGGGVRGGLVGQGGGNGGGGRKGGAGGGSTRVAGVKGS